MRAAIAMLRSAHDRKTARIALFVSSAASGTATSARKKTSKVDCASCSRRAGCVLLKGSRGDGPGVFLSATKNVVEAKPSIASTPTHRFDRDARCAHSDVTDIEYEFRQGRRRDCRSIHDGCAGVNIRARWTTAQVGGRAAGPMPEAQYCGGCRNYPDDRSYTARGTRAWQADDLRQVRQLPTNYSR